jgi:hypothetical protein
MLARFVDSVRSATGSLVWCGFRLNERLLNNASHRVKTRGDDLYFEVRGQGQPLLRECSGLVHVALYEYLTWELLKV